MNPHPLKASSPVKRATVNIIGAACRDILTREGLERRTMECPSHWTIGDAVSRIAREMRIAGDPLLLSVAVNGEPAGAGTALWRSGILEGDDILVGPPGQSQRPGEFTTIALIAIAVASAAASYALARRVAAPPPTNAGDAQRRYAFNRFSQDAAAGETIPVVMGTRPRYGGKVVAKVPGEGEDGESRMKILICLGHGTLSRIGNQTAAFTRVDSSSLTGIYLNDQPIANFPACKVSGRFGLPSQRGIPGFRDTEVLREVGVGGAALENTSGSDRTGGSASGEAFTFTTVDPVDAVVIRVRFPRGLFAVSAAGQTNARRVQYRYRTRLTAGPGAWSNWTVVTVSRADQSEVVSAVRADDLINGGDDPAAQVDVQVERVTADPDDATLIDDMVFDSLVEVRYSNNRYQGYAMLALELVASEQLTTVPRVSIDTDGIKVRVHDGISDASDPEFVEAFSANPADLALEALTNTVWGMGATYTDADIDFESLLAWREYCDEEVPRLVGGGTRKRFAFNFVFDDARDGIEVLRAICKAGRCIPTPSGRVWRFVVDRPQASPVEVFTDGSIAVDDAGIARFTYEREVSTGGIVRPNRLVAQFENELAEGRTDSIGFPELGTLWLADDEPLREQSIRLDGVTDPEQVASELLYQLKRIRGTSRSIRLATSKHALSLQPGDRFDVAMSLPAWGDISGRILRGATTTRIRLDRTLVITEGVTATIEISHLHNTRESRVISMAAGEYPPGTEITLAVALTQAPGYGAEYSVGSIAAALKPFLATRVAPTAAADGSIEWEVFGVEYVPDIYTDTPEDPSLPDYSGMSGLFTPPGPVLNLRAFERIVNDIRIVELAWTQTPADRENTATFRIYRREIGLSTWIIVPQVAAGLRAAVIELADLDRAYQFCVIAVSAAGAALSPYDPRVNVANIVYGLSAPPPPPPTGLSATFSGGAYTLSWDAVDGATGYQVLACGDFTSLPNAGAEDCLVLARTEGTEIAGLELPPTWACWFFVRSIGPSGRLSYTAASLLISSPATPPGQTIKQSRNFNLNTEGTKTNLTYASSRLELTNANAPGVWLSPIVDSGSATLAEITFRPGTANDADDPLLNTDPFSVPSIAADQWGMLTAQPSGLVAMLMPPWPDTEQVWLVEFRTSADGVLYSDWQAVGFGASLARVFRYWQARVTMSRVNPPYRPALRHFNVVLTH